MGGNAAGSGRGPVGDDLEVSAVSAEQQQHGRHHHDGTSSIQVDVTVVAAQPAQRRRWAPDH
jgi:hypothetical protein